MKVYCENCQKTIGQVSDDKIFEIITKAALQMN
jgi:hypothetical protein